MPVDDAFSTRRIVFAHRRRCRRHRRRHVALPPLHARELDAARSTASVVTSSLTGLDTVPIQQLDAPASRSSSSCAGLTIFAFIATILVEGIAGGISSPGPWPSEGGSGRSRGCTDHYVICGYGRVGRRVGQEFREAGVRYVVLDLNEEAIERAREDGALFIKGNGTNDEDLEATGVAHAKGLVASSDSGCRQPRHITLSAQDNPTRPADRRPRVRGGRRREAPAGRGGSHRPAVLDGRQGDG